VFISGADAIEEVKAQTNDVGDAPDSAGLNLKSLGQGLSSIESQLNQLP
jgi:hypothetical protein